MAAPIQRYSDPRLYGNALANPYDISYQWIRTVVNPWHPKCSLITECAIRAMKLATGTLALAVTMFPALVGRMIQIIHYHSLRKDDRTHPPEVIVEGMHLPDLQQCQMPAPIKYHGTNTAAAIRILRWGFDPSKTAAGSKMADAVYVSANDVVSDAYGKDQLILSLDLRKGEIAYASNQTLQKFAVTMNKNFSDKKVMDAVRKLYYLNGYRAIQYELDHYGKEEAWAIYDPSCITIQKIKKSPHADPIPVQRQLLVS